MDAPSPWAAMGAPGPDPTDSHSLPVPSEPASGPRARGAAPSLGTEVRAGPETWARRGPGKPRTPPAQGRGGACSPEPPPPRPRPTSARWGRGGARSQGLGPFATRRSGSSARPPRNRHRRHQLRHRRPLRGQRAEGPTASHAARRQRFAPGAPSSLPAHWQPPTPLEAHPMTHWATRLLKLNVRAVFGRRGEEEEEGLRGGGGGKGRDGGRDLESRLSPPRLAGREP